MIKSDFGTVTVHGARPIILAEFSTIVMALKNGGFSDEEIDRCVEHGKKPREEREAETKKSVEDVLKSIFGCSDDEEKKPDKTVAVVADADTPSEDVAKQISDVVAKAVREMLDKNDEE